MQLGLSAVHLIKSVTVYLTWYCCNLVTLPWAFYPAWAWIFYQKPFNHAVCKLYLTMLSVTFTLVHNNYTTFYLVCNFNPVLNFYLVNSLLTWPFLSVIPLSVTFYLPFDICLLPLPWPFFWLVVSTLGCFSCSLKANVCTRHSDRPKKPGLTGVLSLILYLFVLFLTMVTAFCSFLILFPIYSNCISLYGILEQTGFAMACLSLVCHHGYRTETKRSWSLLACFKPNNSVFLQDLTRLVCDDLPCL